MPRTNDATERKPSVRAVPTARRDASAGRGTTLGVRGDIELFPQSELNAQQLGDGQTAATIKKRGLRRTVHYHFFGHGYVGSNSVIFHVDVHRTKGFAVTVGPKRFTPLVSR